MSWSMVLGILGTGVPERTLEYNLYKPGTQTGVVLYYFNQDSSSGIPAFCRFVDIVSQQVVGCPIQGRSYYMEVRAPPGGIPGEFPDEYLTIIYEDDTGKPMPPGPSFIFTQDKHVGNFATYFTAIGSTSDGLVDFQIIRKDIPDLITYVRIRMNNYPFDCRLCGCPEGELCTNGNCVPIVPEPEEPQEPEPEQPDECEDLCGGKCYGSCPGSTKCELNEAGEYECWNSETKPIWTKWWFWTLIILIIIMFIVIGVLLSKKKKK